MLTRLYVDNYKCLVDFEFRPERLQLIVGRNGTGKTTVGEVLADLQLLLTGSAMADSSLGFTTYTFGARAGQRQKFELDATVHNHTYAYSVTFDAMEIESETLICDGEAVWSQDDRLRLRGSHSLVATAVPNRRQKETDIFREWMAEMVVVKPNPAGVVTRAETSIPKLNRSMSNFGAWFLHYSASTDEARSSFEHDIRDVVQGLRSVEMMDVGIGDTTKILVARFDGGLEAAQDVLEFSELSDGQRALIMLYALLHFSIRAGRTVFIDEPDNYLALPEIEPWLNAAIDALDEGNGQLIMISHHPELIDRLVHRHGVVFTREKGGPVRAVQYQSDPGLDMPPSEEFARGWERV